MRAGLALVLIVVILGACAIQEAPPGGPVDNRPPRIVSTVPAFGSLGVDIDTEIRIEFDEAMTKTRFERFVTAHPRIIVGKAGWKGRTFVLQPREPLHPDTTYVIELKPGYSDAHAVQNPEMFQFAFATSSAIDSGSISGYVFFRRRPSEKAILRLFVMPTDSGFTPEGTIGAREVAVNDEGEFAFDYLPTDDRDFLIWAFEDTDDNGAYVTDVDVAVAHPDTVPVDGTYSIVSDLRLFIVDPKEPGRIAGTIVNETGIDTIPITVTLHEVADTLPPTYVTILLRDGEFKFPSVLQGRYTLQAFIDFGRDSLCGFYPCPGDTAQQCEEPCWQYTDTLSIRPGQDLEVEEPLVLETPQEE